MYALPKQNELVVFNTGKSAGKWFARVKNNENGFNWIKRFREKNRQLIVTLYGRSPNRKSRCREAMAHYYPNYHKPSIAETIVVYVEKNSRKNKNIKTDEHITIDDNYYNVHKVWVEKGTSYLLAFSRYVGYITLTWSDKRQMWVK